MVSESSENEIDNTRAFLKMRLQRDLVTFRNHDTDWKMIRDLIMRTAKEGESNSVLLIGPRGCGKTTLVTSVLHSLMVDKSYYNNAITVYLNGLIHIDDSIALKSATAQLNLENAVDGKVFGSFAENLAFLLECLKAGDSSTSKSVIFILEEFDLFCAHHNQTLLYNLFDVAQSAQAPICVVGITCRLDVIELFEKRVKSRFSHRQIFLLPNNDFDNRVQLFRDQLSLFTKKEAQEFRKHHPAIPMEAHTNKELMFLFKNSFDPEQFTFSPKWIEQWNKKIDGLATNKKVLKALETMYDYDVMEATFKLFLFQLVAQLDEQHASIEVDDVVGQLEKYLNDDKVSTLTTLSVLEICLVIAMKHHSQIYDRDPFNFEMLYTRFRKFSKSSTTMQNVEKRLALTAFEHIKYLELIAPLTTTLAATNKVQKGFQMHRLLLTYTQIDRAIAKYQHIPTDVAQWARSSIL